MTPRDLTTLASTLATDIIYELQVDRTGMGEYMISGYPDDYRIHVSRHTNAPLTKPELSRVAALVKADVESYLGGILRVGDQLVRSAQDVAQVVTLIERFGPNARSVDELWGNIEGVMDTDTLSEEFRMLIEMAFDPISQGNLPEFYQVVQQLYPDDSSINIPAMPDTDYGTESIFSISTPSMPFSTPGTPMPAKGLASAAQGLFLSKSSMPVRLVKHAQNEDDVGDFDFLEYYTRGVDPGSLEEVDQLINLQPEQLSGPPEEAPTQLSEFLEQVPLQQTEEQRETLIELQEEIPSEEEPKEEEPKEEGPKLPGYETELTEYPTEPPQWWLGYRNIVGNLPPGTIDEIEQRLDENAEFRAANEENLYTDEAHYKDQLALLGRNYDISSMPAANREDIKARDLARGRMRQQEFNEIWAPYALMHAFTIAGMPGMRRPKVYLESWIRAHFGDEFGDKFAEVSGKAAGVNMHKEDAELIEQINDWRDPRLGEGHGTDPSQWSAELLAQIPETLQIDTGLTLGDVRAGDPDDPRAPSIGTVTIDNPVYTTYIKRTDPLKVPVNYGTGKGPRLDDIRRLQLEFSEETIPEPGKEWASEKQQRWYHSVGPGSRR